ncbi:P-loop containing nucleoside triphosphate hydrolase protein [Trametes elegans]|nr:P-loop containing nucleoside triphosphate hydrolase protein [Trametes elegans]
MSLLSTSRFAVRAATLPPELVVACLHTTTPCLGKRDSRDSAGAPSRTRLVKDLKPPSRGRLEVAPSFTRDRAPHHDREIKQRLSHREESKAPSKLSESSADLPGALTLSSGAPRARDFLETPTTRRSSSDPGRPKVDNPLSEDFDISKRSVPTTNLPTEFTSPPLMDGLLQSIHEVLGPDAKPTPIQALALKHIVNAESASAEDRTHHGQWLLASETGSGKSMAYLLPVLQDLKHLELSGAPRPSAAASGPRRALNPRALVLAPTHELTRQLSGFAKELLHHTKLRVLCASRANTPSRKKLTAARMAEAMDGADEGEVEITRAEGVSHPVDLVVGTPSKILELIRGRGWDHEKREIEDSWGGERRSHRKVTIGEPEMGLADIEWVVVDEADVLFDPDFQEATRTILADISAARGHPVPFEPELDLSATDKQENPTPLDYPFNLVLTSATIPSSLATYLDRFHPTLTRLASPYLHRLPAQLKTEHVSWTGGNRNADVEHRLRRVWYEDAERGAPPSKVLVFCNRNGHVEQLGAFLREKGIANVALTSAGDARRHGSNHHLDGFLRVRRADADAAAATDAGAGAGRPGDQIKEVPHVMITTSLLSRGLDFAPDVRHVFIVDEPRNMVDFLHRAGRSGRAGAAGKVVVFGKMKGRGSEKARVVRKKVGALRA